MIIPTYNRATYLPGAIDSVLAQTFEDFEVVVVDDCSSDDTLAVLRPYGDRIRVIAQSPNRGPSATRNAGLAAARGELIALLDSDDVWFHDKLRHQVALLDADPGIDCVTSTLQCVDEAGRILDLTNPKRSGTPGAMDLAAVVERRNGAPSTLLIRARVAAAVGPFDERMRYCEDIDYLLRVATRSRWIHDSKIVGHYRVHSGNISNWCLGLVQGDVTVYEKWLRTPLPPAASRLLRAHLALARYKLAAFKVELASPERVETARLYMQAALGDPLVDARISGRSSSLPARAWQLSKPWISAAACLLGVATPLRRSIRSRFRAT